MKTTEIVSFARKLLDAHGDKAEVEAAQKAVQLEAEGKSEEAETWKKIRNAIHQMRPPHES